jgi:hypothetical protein
MGRTLGGIGRKGESIPRVAWASGGPAVRFAYADPPYIGQAKKHYAKEAAANGRVAAEIDHADLVRRLTEGYEGWALSLSSPSLKQILAMCPDDVRVGGWFKPFASFKKGVDPAYAWEPVIYKTQRKWRADQPTVRDWVSANITLERGVSGAKPDAFCFWLFDLLGMERHDLFHDLYPGSGAVTRAHAMWCNQLEIA